MWPSLSEPERLAYREEKCKLRQELIYHRRVKKKQYTHRYSRTRNETKSIQPIPLSPLTSRYVILSRPHAPSSFPSGTLFTPQHHFTTILIYVNYFHPFLDNHIIIYMPHSNYTINILGETSWLLTLVTRCSKHYVTRIYQ